MLSFRHIQSSESESDDDLVIDPTVLSEIQQQNDSYQFELEINPNETSDNIQSEGDYACEINTVQTESNSNEEDIVDTFREDLLGKLFIADESIDSQWISSIGELFNKMDPEEQHDVCYSLVTRLLTALQFHISCNSQEEIENETQNNNNEIFNNDKHVSFEEGMNLLRDSSDDELIVDINDNHDEAYDQNYQNKEPKKLNEEVPQYNYSNNRQKKKRPLGTIHVVDEEEEETKRAIRRLSRKANKWKRLARDRLAEIQRDIEFRDNLIRALTDKNSNQKTNLDIR